MPMSLRGYHPPEPPFQCVDDIRPTIPWFEEDNNDDEFDWKGVEDDLKDNGSTLLSQGLSAATSKILALAGPSLTNTNLFHIFNSGF